MVGTGKTLDMAFREVKQTDICIVVSIWCHNTNINVTHLDLSLLQLLNQFRYFHMILIITRAQSP